jgi:hypothetical protein
MASSTEMAQVAKDYEKNHGGVHISYVTGKGQLVCNQFVLAVIRSTVDPSFPNELADDFAKSGYFTKVDVPQKGDLVHWPGHIGIVTDPDMGYFWGSQTSTGVAESNYKHGYWDGQYGGKKPDYFLRWSGS